MIKQPISVVFDLDAKIGNSKLIAISHVEDKYNEVLEVNVRQNGAHIDLTGATAIARMVLHAEKDYLISDSVPCTINDSGNILIPFDNAVVKIMQGTVKIEVSISRGEDDVLTLQFPLWVSVKGSILGGAEVTPESEGTIPDLLKDAANALDDAKEALEASGDYENLDNKPQINGVTLSGNKTSGELRVAGWKTAEIDNCIEDGVLYSTSINDQAAYVLARNITTSITQYAFCRDGRVMWRTRQAETPWQPAGEWSAWEGIGGADDYNDLLNKPQIQANGQTSPLSGTLAFSSYEFFANVVGTITNIQLKNNVFESYLSPTNDILYNFNLLGEQVQHSGVYKIRKIDVTNLPQEFSNAGQTLYVYHFLTNTTYSDLIRMVTYETTDGVKMWIQLVTLGGMDASGNVQVTTQTDWVELTGTPKKDISGAVVTLNQSVYTYDGTSKAPSVTSVVLNGQTLTAGTDYAVIANPAANAGQYVVVVNGMGDYKGTVTTAWEIAKAQATINGDDYITITGIDDPVTKTYTTDGDGAFSFAITGNIATVANIGGEVTITPTALGSSTMTVTLSDGANYLGATKTVPVEIVRPVTVFGVVWDYSLSSPQLARLTPQTDPLGVVTTVPLQEPTACVGNDGNGQSDFDNYMPWAGMQRYNYINGQVVDFVDYSNGETFVYIPEFWSKIVDDSANSKMYFYIADSEVTGFTKHLGSDRYVGRYGVNTNYYSLSGNTLRSETSFINFRNNITGIDHNHFMYDFSTYSALVLLYIIEFANLDSQLKIGEGITAAQTKAITGLTDVLNYHTGRVSGTNNLSAIHYRYIENLWGNIWCVIDGVIVDHMEVKIMISPIDSNYINTGLSIPNTNWSYITRFEPYANCYLIPKTASGGSSSTYACDFYGFYDVSAITNLRIGGKENEGKAGGLFYWLSDIPSPGTVSKDIGARSILILGGDS